MTSPSADAGASGTLLKQAAQRYAAADYPAAEALCRTIIRQDPRCFDALHLLGVLLTRQNKPDDAIRFLRQAVAEQPDHGLARLNLGNALLAAKQYNEALLVSGGPDAASLNNLGLAYRGLARHEEAATVFHRTVTLHAAYAPAWFNLATTLVKLGRLEQALSAARTALHVAPPDTPVSRLADVTNEIGRILIGLGRPEEALGTCQQFLARHPGETSVTWNMSLTLLLLGRFAEGWHCYECRFDVPGHDQRPENTIVPDPNSVAGKHVLILTEQGRGDMIQFIRYAPMLAAKGATVSVQAYPDLVPLLAAMPGLNTVVSVAEPAPDADIRTMVMSLPLAFATTLATVPAAVPYLGVPPDRTAIWAERLGTRRQPRIGLAWSGSTHSYERSAMPAETLAPLLGVSGFEFHCLQQNIREADALWLDITQSSLIRHDTDLHDFADTAALIDRMDLIVTIDTAIAHIAGGLAKPVWIMLPFNPDWRWLMHRADSPWYVTARLYRQPKRGDWTSVVQAVIRAIPGVFPTDCR